MSGVTRASSVRRQPQRTAKNPPPPPPPAPPQKKVSVPQTKKPIPRPQVRLVTTNKPGTSSRITRSSFPERKRIVHDDATNNKVIHRFIQLGERCQVTMPTEGPREGPSTSPERETCVWKMDDEKITPEELEKFCVDTYEKFGLPSERAMYALYMNEFDKEKAMKQAKESALLQEQWSDNDRYIFNGLYATYGKNFGKIHKIMAYKSMRSLIEHYYKVKMISYKIGGLAEANKPLGSMGSIDDLNGHFETEKDVESICDNCGAFSQLHQVNNEMQCMSCKRFFEEFNYDRPVDRSERRAALRYEEDARRMAEKFTELFLHGDRETLRREFTTVRNKRQSEAREMRLKAAQQEQTSMRAVKYLASSINLNTYRKYTSKKKPKPRLRENWTKKEQNIALRLLIRYSGDSETVSKILATKTVEQIQNLYNKYSSAIKEELKKAREQSDLAEKVEEMYRDITEQKKEVDIVELD
ncbi:unnamed protein product [Bursaphelenchus xylophilus]|uniref:(pine wood nematode) hypothetical protein n=1 Tax=Bursaphelenchus xylophilus TaxID=6326 RepID=A0A1I7RP35_BURXY|nr:unnamed protein product [Bursaphelenchus xylophilus]CAG9124508.1 unnamed protein product [Bursaphelenchus xylophilus]